VSGTTLLFQSEANNCYSSQRQTIARIYSLHPKKSVVLEFQTSYLTIRLIQNFYINIIYFVKTYFIIRDILLMINLFCNLHKIFE